MGPFLLEGQFVDTKVQKEYERLATLFQDVDSNKTKLVDELLKKGYINAHRVCIVSNKVNHSKRIINHSKSFLFGYPVKAAQTPA